MKAYYNEIDGYCCDWLSNLMDAGLITTGKIDDRPIQDVRPDDVRGYERVHWFAGIAGWDIALNLAGWPDDRPVWTGSCPCQPFSAAGKRTGAADERHLWPHWFNLIRECKPAVVFGENVEQAIGWGWLDAVCSDLEAEGYATGAAVLPACGVGSPHIRQRVWFVAESVRAASEWRAGGVLGAQAPLGGAGVVDGGQPDRFADGGEVGFVANPNERHRSPEGLQRAGGDVGGMGHPTGIGHERNGSTRQWRNGFANNGADFGGSADAIARAATGEPGSTSRTVRAITEFWSDCAYLPCTDGRTRPTQSILFEVVDGLSDRLGFMRAGDKAILNPLIKGSKNRAGKLRAYGNAIVPQVAAEFIKAFTSRC